MDTLFDVQQLLKRFGIFVYMGNRLADLEMMEEEIKELYFSQLLPKEDLQRALVVIKREMASERNKERE
ncbi:MAG TPA: YqgQ family protein [Bacillaceae bacterium]